MKVKFLSVLMVVLLAFAMLPSFAAADDPVGLDVLYLKIDGEEHSTYDDVTENVLEVRRGQTLPIRVRVLANTDVEDVQVTAGIYGYKYSQFESDLVFQTTRTFDMDAGREKSVDLELKVPVNMRSDAYGETPTKLRIFVTDRNNLAKVFEYNLDVQGVDSDNALVIKEAYLNPAHEVLAGRALSALVKVENVGDYDLDSVTLTVSVPQLNIKDVETLDELEAGKKATFEETILRFPSNAQPGVYTVEFKVKYDEYYTTTKTATVEVLVDPCAEDCEVQSPNEQSFVTVPGSQNVVAGASAVYPVMINNAGKNAKSYVLSIQGVDGWATARVDPSAAIIVQAGKTETVFVYVEANADAASGSKVFQLSIQSDDMVKQVPLTAVVEQAPAKSWDGLKKTLEVGLIILVIILILIGLVVGFNKLRGSDDEDEDAKTYY